MMDSTQLWKRVAHIHTFSEQVILNDVGHNVGTVGLLLSLPHNDAQNVVRQGIRVWKARKAHVRSHMIMKLLSHRIDQGNWP